MKENSMNNNIIIVFWDVCFLVGQGHRYVKPSMLRSHGDMSRTTVHRCLAQLVEMGMLNKLGTGRYTVSTNSAFVYDFLDAIRTVNEGR